MTISQAALEITQKTVTKVLTNVINASLDKHWRDRRKFSYVSMIVPTGITAPSESEILTNGRLMFGDKTQERVEVPTLSPVDVYIYCNKEGISFLSKKGKIILTVDQ